MMGVPVGGPRCGGTWLLKHNRLRRKRGEHRSVWRKQPLRRLDNKTSLPHHLPAHAWPGGRRRAGQITRRKTAAGRLLWHLDLCRHRTACKGARKHCAEMVEVEGERSATPPSSHALRPHPPATSRAHLPPLPTGPLPLADRRGQMSQNLTGQASRAHAISRGSKLMVNLGPVDGTCPILRWDLLKEEEKK